MIVLKKKTVDMDEYMRLIHRAYASSVRYPLTSLTNTSLTTTSRFSKYTKEQLTTYLQQAPQYEKQLRDASIYMYTNSMQYYNLINFHALMPVWTYSVSPMKFDRAKFKPDAVLKQYQKVTEKLQIMNLSHEMDKVMRVCFREDVFYGICYESKDAFSIQKLNPDYCKITSVEDGVLNFAFDFSQLTEEMLPLYPPQFESMWRAYQGDQDLKWQEVPADIGICIKVNEDLTYPFPPFAPSMPLLYDIEAYRELILDRTQIDIYKLLLLQIPMDEKLIPMDMEQALQYYEQILRIVPETIGVVMAPMPLNEVKLDKTGLSDTDEVARSEQHFWSSSGTSPLLFGGDANGSVTALKLSIKANEQIVLAVMRQVERWLNRRIRKISGTIKFKVDILPITNFNQDERAAMYETAASYGLPTKSMYAAATGIELNDISALAYLENEVLDYPGNFIPLSTSYTQSGDDPTADEGGRPTNESKGEDLTEAGEQTQNDEENEKREGAE